MNAEYSPSTNDDYNSALAGVLTMIMQEGDYDVNQLALLDKDGNIDLKPVLRQPGGRLVFDLINEAARFLAWGAVSDVFPNNNGQLSVEPILEAMIDKAEAETTEKAKDPSSVISQIHQNPPWSGNESKGLGRFSKRNKTVNGRKRRRRWNRNGRR